MISHTKSPFSAKDDQLLFTELMDPQLAENPDAFVMFVYPWGKPGTILERVKEPRAWQRDEFHRIAEHIKNNKARMEMGLEPEVYYSATVSGRGPGKSAFVAMIDHWVRTTVLGATSVITANTETQLKTKTWPEVGKWHTLAINSHWFDRTALSVRPAPWYERELVKQLKIDTGYYYSQAITWSEENPDAFAGQHNMYGTLVVFDEASGIPKKIWTNTEGFFTEPVLHRYWFVFSNGRRNTGPFFECFHKDRAFWPNRRQIDSRTVEGTDKKVLQKIIDKHGEDSDEARIEVKGQFPRQGEKQFIPRELVEDARIRPLTKDEYAPLILGVDIARMGSDSTVLCWRRGRDARSIPMVTVSKRDNLEVATIVAEWIDKTNPDAVFIDAGNGVGVIDILRGLNYKVHEVWFGSEKTRHEEWKNKRIEMYADIRDWLTQGGCIPDDDELVTDLTAPEYEFIGLTDVKKLESKEKMKKRGFASPDKGDALGCTFWAKVARKDIAVARHKLGRPAVRMAQGMDYNILG